MNASECTFDALEKQNGTICLFHYLYVDLVRGSGNVLLVEPDPDGVLAGLLHRVAHVAGAVFPVLEGEIR